MFIVIMGMCMSCSHKIYEPVQSTSKSDSVFKHTDSIRWKDSVKIVRRLILKDSVRMHDSVVLKLDNQGKQVGYEKYVIRDHIHYEMSSADSARIADMFKQRIDSLSSVKSDTVVIKKKPTTWENIKMGYGGYAFIICIILILGITVYITLKVKQKL